MAILLGGETTGAYFDACLRTEAETDRFSVFVNYDADGSEGFETVQLDVDAVGPVHAREIAQLAISRDYDPRGRIVHIEREGEAG